MSPEAAPGKDRNATPLPGSGPSPARHASGVERFVAALTSIGLGVASVVPIARFVGIALQRLNYPYELEWVEGGIISHIQVVLAGQQLYREPSLDFTPFIYAPLYYYVSALPSLVLGVGHLAPRLVSFGSILGCFVLLARWVRKETGDAVAGLAAAGLLASAYQITGCWMDLARVDSLFLFLTFAANLLARNTQTPRRAALVGVLLAAACFTKQLGIPLALPPLLFLGMREPRLGLIAGIVAGGISGVVGLAFQLSSHGWFYYYLFDLPSRHPLEWPRLLPDTQTYFLGVTLPMTLAGVAVLCGVGFRRRRRKQWLYVALFVLLGCVTSLLPFLKSGGYPNGLIPAYAVLSLAAGIQLGALRRRDSALGSAGPGLFGALLVAFQFAQLSYDPSVALPSAEDRAANEHVVARMAALPKPIFVTASSDYSRLVQEHGAPLHAVALCDVFKGGGPEAIHLHQVMVDAIHAHHFATIVLDRVAGFLPVDLVQLIQSEYQYKGTLLQGVPGDAMWPKTGAAIRPDTVWVARSLLPSRRRKR